MKKRRIFAVVMAAVMTLSMVACGEKQTGNDTPTTAPTATTAPTEAPEATATPVPTEAPVQEASIDFEDGNFGFAMIKTKPRRADESVLSLANYNGSNALYVENAGGAEMYVGIDVDAILGDKVTEVRKISMTLGTEHSDGKFASTAGYLLAYTGEALTETKLEGWSVYMANKNPKTVEFNLPADVAFTAGNDNYICLSKMEDNGNVMSSLYIDDISFFDANGNVLKGDTTVVMEAPAGFARPASSDDDDEPAVNVVKVAGDEKYAGDWGQSAIVPLDVLSKMSGDVTVTYKIELQPGCDNYVIAPMNASWGKLDPAVMGFTGKTAADEGEKYFCKPDGFFQVADTSTTEITFTLPAATVAELIASGGFAAQTNGIVVYEILLSEIVSDMITETVAGDEKYAGDWGQSAIVPLDVLSKFPGDVTVTYKIELQPGCDNYVIAPMNASWGKLDPAVMGFTGKTAADEGEKYFCKPDGFFQVADTSATEITFTLPAATVAELIASGGFAAQTNGIVVYEIVLQGKAPETMKETVAGDEKYAGDWGQSAIVPLDVLSKFPGDVTVTYKIELQPGCDNYVIAPMNASWGKLDPAVMGFTGKTAADEGEKYFCKPDGFFQVADTSATEITFTLPAATVAELIASGGFAAQTNGIVVYEIVLEGTVPETMKETVAGDEKYAGDWGQSAIVPLDVLSKFPGDVTVTYKIELQPGCDNYVIAPMNASWGKFDPAVMGFTGKTAADEGEKYFCKPDGFFQVADTSTTEITFTLPAATVVELIASGGFAAQTNGIVVYEIVLEGTAAASAPATDAPAVEEPAAPAGPVVEGNTVTIVDGTWWTEAPLTIEQLLGDVDPATVKSVTFTGTTDFTLAYTNNSGTGTAAADNPYWTQLAGATTYTATDIDFSNYLLKLCLSKGDNVEYTITWTVE